MMRHTCI